MYFFSITLKLLAIITLVMEFILGKWSLVWANCSTTGPFKSSTKERVSKLEYMLGKYSSIELSSTSWNVTSLKSTCYRYIYMYLSIIYILYWYIIHLSIMYILYSQVIYPYIRHLYWWIKLRWICQAKSHSSF